MWLRLRGSGAGQVPGRTPNGGAVSTLAETLCQWPLPETRPCVLVTLLLAPPEALHRAIARHRGRASHRPVFVVTDPDISALRAAGFFAEHLPAPGMLGSSAFGARPEWYLKRRMALIQAKWRPRWEVTDGVSFDRYLHACVADATLPSE